MYIPLMLPRPAGALLAVTLLAAAPLGGQTNLERVVNGFYTPSHDYDLIHQRIEVRNFDWDSTSFDARVAFTLVSLRPGFDSVVLDMGRALRVRRVTPRAGASTVPAIRSWCTWRPAGFGDTVRFTVDYHGAHPSGRGPLLLQGRRPRPSAAAGLQRGRDRRQSAVAPDLGRPGRQDHLGARGHGAGQAHGRVQRPSGERPRRGPGPAHRHLAAGEARVHLSHLAWRPGRSPRSPSAGAAFRWSTTCTGRTAPSPGRCSASRPT